MIKRLIGGLLSVLILFSATACMGGGTESESQTKGGLPNYDLKKDELHFTIGAWYSPNTKKEEQFLWLKESGINLAYVQGEYGKRVGDASFEKTLELLQKYGVDAFGTSGTSGDASTRLSDIHLYDYSSYSNYRGLNVYDEPKMGDIPVIKAAIENYGKYFPNQELQVNLFPIKSNMWGNASYDEYLRENCEALSSYPGEKWLSVDAYPLLYINGEYTFENLWLANIERVKQMALEYDYKSNFFIQTMPYGTKNFRVPTKADMSLQTYCCLALGMDGIAHFCYATPSAGAEFDRDDCYAMIDKNGERTSIYYATKEINEQILYFDHVLMQFNWQGVFAKEGEGKPRNIAFNNLGYALKESQLKGVNVLSSTEDLLMGVYKDEEGNYGYILVNYGETTTAKSSTVNLEFDGKSKIRVYRNAEKLEENLTDGKYEVTLDVGEGIFVIPY